MAREHLEIDSNNPFEHCDSSAEGACRVPKVHYFEEVCAKVRMVGNSVIDTHLRELEIGSTIASLVRHC